MAVGRPEKLLRHVSIVLATSAAAITLAGSLRNVRADIDWNKEQQFWAFRVPTQQPRPAVRNTEWPRQPLDYFVLARLEQNNLEPSPAAGKRTLVRRVTFDLTGLPPAPAEVRDFLEDNRADAYARLVERLLASPQFGEHLASLWLPLARYAEDQAHQVGSDTKFFYPNAFKYRAWVIQAFNRDLPYDRFIRLQIAADAEGAPPDDLAALGFLGLGPKYYNRNRIEVMADEWEDRVDTVSRSMLGLTIGCARCHDHKFDPITTADYYALAGVFASTQMVNKNPSQPAEKNDVSADKMPATVLHMVEDSQPHDLNIFLRGNPEKKGAVAPRRFVRILSATEPKPFREGSGRKELAQAIADPQNPLTARVMVNRLWGQFFGRPLVDTPSNFGHSGQLPSHPKLLDDLAARFVGNGWSIKSLAREFVLSSTYQQSSFGDPSEKRPDPSNVLLWRMNRRRLSVEQWRDAVLFLAGDIAWEGGKSMELDDPANHRRTVYGRISRLKLSDLLTQFDYPDANVHAEKRAVTITPLQKLFVLNSPFMISQAKTLAARLCAAPSGSSVDRIQRAYELLFARPAMASETKLGLEFLQQPASGTMSRWDQYAQALLACNEMLYLD